MYDANGAYVSCMSLLFRLVFKPVMALAVTLYVMVRWIL